MADITTFGQNSLNLNFEHCVRDWEGKTGIWAYGPWVSKVMHGQKSRTVSGANCRRVPAAVRVFESAQRCVLFVTLRLLLLLYVFINSFQAFSKG